MGNAYCTVKYEFGGRQYQTVHGLHSGLSVAAGQNTFAEIDLVAWGFEALAVGDLDARTDATVTPFNWGNLLEGIITMHRFLQSPLVRLKQIYISDGFTVGIGTGPFATFDLDLQCQAPHLPGTADQIAPANIALMIDKTSGQFSRRGGRMWLRGALAKASFELGDADGVTLTASARSTLSPLLDGFLEESSIGGEASTFEDYFGDGTLGADATTVVQYSIANTVKVTVDGVARRALSNWTEVGTLSIDDAQSRDTRRRGKRNP